MSDADKIMGFIPKDQYLKITYYLLLASAAGGLLLALLGVLGLYVPLGGLFTLAGLCGLILALLGFFLFKTEFSSLDQSHLMYLSVLIAVFFVVGLILGASFAIVPTVMFLVLLLVNSAQLLLIFTGFNSWKHGRSVTKDNVKDEVQLALKRG